MSKLIGVGGDEKLANELLDVVGRAVARNVDTITILVTVAASMGSLIGENSPTVLDADVLAAALGNGIKDSARQAFSDRLDKRCP